MIKVSLDKASSNFTFFDFENDFFQFSELFWICDKYLSMFSNASFPSTWFPLKNRSDEINLFRFSISCTYSEYDDI